MHRFSYTSRLLTAIALRAPPMSYLRGGVSSNVLARCYHKQPQLLTTAIVGGASPMSYLREGVSSNELARLFPQTTSVVHDS